MLPEKKLVQIILFTINSHPDDKKHPCADIHESGKDSDKEIDQ